MVISNSDIYNLAEIILRLKNSGKTFSVKEGFILNKNLKMLMPVYESIVETRNEILTEYGDIIDEVTGTIQIPPEKVKEVNKKLNEIIDLESEVDLNLLPESFLDTISNGVELNLNQIDSLSLIIDFEK